MNLSIAEDRIRADNKLPCGFVFSRWECFPKTAHPEKTLYVELSGAVYGKYVKGPKRGRPNYKLKDKGSERTFVVPVAEYAEWEKDWIVRTGNCPRCTGEGKTVSRMDFVEGKTHYVPCRDCGGSGKKQP